MICPKVPGTGIIPSGECLGDPVVLWVRELSCFFAFELEARLVFVHFDTTTRCEVTGWCCDQPRHFSGEEGLARLDQRLDWLHEDWLARQQPWHEVEVEGSRFGVLDRVD